MAGVRSNQGAVNTDGYYYQLYTLLHCVDRLRKNEYVRDYKIGSAVEGYGALDDVVFNATFDSGEKNITAIHVKYSTIGNAIDERYLCQNPRTYLYKYFESFMKIKQTTPLEQIEQLILWTNMPILPKIYHWFEEFVPDSHENDIIGEGGIKGLNYKRYRIKKGNWREFIAKCLDQLRKSSKSQSKKKDFPAPSDEWEQFYERFVFYVNVTNVEELKAFLVRNIGDFNDVCRLVERCVTMKMTTNDQIDRLFTLAKLRNCIETGPYTKLIFNDLDELQCKVKELFDNERKSFLSIQAQQDVDCTVARVISIVEQVLAAELKRYLVFSYETLKEKWNEILQIVNDPKLVAIGLSCLIISSITNDEVRNVRSKLSDLKVIFVGCDLENDFNDDFNISCLDDSNKTLISARKIRFSRWQKATAYEIFGDELFQKENYSMILELYKLQKDATHEITVCEPLLDSYYRPRTAKLININDDTSKIDLLNQTDFDKLMICDGPGMGKTTELIKLCSDFSEKYQDHLVVYLHCKSAVSKWSNSAEDLICNTVTNCSALTTYVIQKIILLGKVIFLMDGYDEASSAYNDKTQTFVSEIFRLKMLKLYIATRPQCKDELKEILGECGLCYLEPFSEDAQLAYLKDFWSIDKCNDEATRIMIDTHARSIVNQFRSAICGNAFTKAQNTKNLQDCSSSIIGSPLQTNMIADIYKDRDFRLSKSHTLGFMFKEFIEYKFMDYSKQHFDPTNTVHALIINDLRESFLHNHAVAALKIFHDDQVVPALDYVSEDDSESETREELLRKRKETEQLCENLQFYGLIYTHPTIGFISSTYHEYFLALHIITYSMEIRSLEYFMDMYVDKSNSLVYRFMDYLLDHIDPRVNPNRSLYKCVYSVTLPTDYISPSSARLHPDKMIEFHAALYQWRYSKLKCLFTPLIFYRMFNMLEVIYDSLRAEIKSQVRLCLNPVCDDHQNSICFCLKELKTADTLISILNILLKKSSETFVTQYLSHQEEHLLELLGIPGYSNLLDWFTEILPQLNENQRIALTKIITKKTT